MAPMSSRNQPPGKGNEDRLPAGIRAFTLIELLVVVAIMVVRYTLTVPAITSPKGASGLTGEAAMYRP